MVSCKYKTGERENDEGARCHFPSATIALFCFHACNEFNCVWGPPEPLFSKNSLVFPRVYSKKDNVHFPGLVLLV